MNNLRKQYRKETGALCAKYNNNRHVTFCDEYVEWLENKLSNHKIVNHITLSDDFNFEFLSKTESKSSFRSGSLSPNGESLFSETESVKNSNEQFTSKNEHPVTVYTDENGNKGIKVDLREVSLTSNIKINEPLTNNNNAFTISQMTTHDEEHIETKVFNDRVEVIYKLTPMFWTSTVRFPTHTMRKDIFYFNRKESVNGKYVPPQNETYIFEQ